MGWFEIHDSYEHERRQTAALERIVQLLEAQQRPHRHEWADIHGVVGCGTCRVAYDDYDEATAPVVTFPCGHERDPQTTRHTCAGGSYT